LLNQICDKEKIEVSEEVLERIVEVAEGSPRNALNILNRVIRLDEVGAQLDAVMKSDVKVVAFDLARSLLWQKSSWTDIAKILKGIDGEDPEGIRRLILKCASGECLKGGKFADRAYLLLNAFDTPFFDVGTGMSGLVRSCWECFHSK
jgi:DNA polymerase III delta prime subunit